MPTLVAVFLLALGALLVVLSGGPSLSPGHVALGAAAVALLVLPVERHVRR